MLQSNPSVSVGAEQTHWHFTKLQGNTTLCVCVCVCVTPSPSSPLLLLGLLNKGCGGARRLVGHRAGLLAHWLKQVTLLFAPSPLVVRLISSASGSADTPWMPQRGHPHRRGTCRHVRTLSRWLPTFSPWSAPYMCMKAAEPVQGLIWRNKQSGGQWSTKGRPLIGGIKSNNWYFWIEISISFKTLVGL